MAQIIGIIQVKGGAGRSTVATNLACMMSIHKPAVLIDCDMPQGTSASWFAIRKAAGRQGNLSIATARDHLELVEKIRVLGTQHDYIIIDAPPRIAEITRASLILSDLCIIPTGPSLPDIWAISDLLKTIEQARERKPDVAARVLWNKFRATSRSAHELSRSAVSELKLQEMGSRLGYRVAYSDAYGEGMSVLEWHDRAAQDEMRMLGIELEYILKTKFMRKAA